MIDTCLSNAEFSEAGAAALQLPSPACLDKLGKTVRGREVVDPHGEVVRATIGRDVGCMDVFHLGKTCINLCC